MPAMLRIIRRLFTKPSPPLPPGSIPKEYWVADLSNQEASRFLAEADERYQTLFLDGAIRLELFRPDLFAWTPAQPYRYNDISLDARIQLQPDTPVDSAGFILRMTDAGSFICILASDRGLRMDSFFNGEARTIVPWTPCPWISMAEGVLLSIVARGSRYIVLADGRFAIEAEDETTEAGTVAFAARSTGMEGSAGAVGMAEAAEAVGAAIIHSLSIESRPFEVEIAFYRYARLMETDEEQRRQLARCLFANGDYLSSLIHLKKLDEAVALRERLRLRPGRLSGGKSGTGSDGVAENQADSRSGIRARDAFLRAECYLRLEMYEDAGKAIEASLTLDPALPEAVEERYNILYLRGRLTDLRNGLTVDAMQTSANPRLSNLLGHACFGLGLWHDAAVSYEMAAGLDPAMPIYSLNAARAWERAGDMSQAAAAWIQAAHGFFDQSAWEDAQVCANRLKELKYDQSAAESLEGRIAYGIGDFETAEKVFAKLARKKALDAPSSYLYGLLLAKKNKRPAAITAFRTAIELDPSMGLYHYRLAESLMIARSSQNLNSGAARAEAEEALAKALELDPDFPWAQNLAGQLAMEDGDHDEAAIYFSKAVAALPEAPEPAINLSATLAGLRRYDEALLAVEKLAGSHHSAANQGGNVLALCGRLEEAEAWYRKALAQPGTVSSGRGPSGETGAPTPVELAEYRTNLAAVLIELDKLAEAQDELRQALQSRMDARSLYLMGDLARQFGDLPRAEAAYVSALERAPADPDILQRLADLHLLRGRYQQARDLAAVLASTKPEASEKILASVRRATQEEISCDSCGRRWMVPKSLPPVPRAIVRGELPDDSPAGTCAGCGAVLCVACGKKQLVDGRFSCLQCGGKITLNDDRVRWIVRGYVYPDSRTI
jgi:tetratricopeptide (TPR) repeat protein